MNFFYVTPELLEAELERVEHLRTLGTIVTGHKRFSNTIQKIANALEANIQLSKYYLEKVVLPMHICSRFIWKLDADKQSVDEWDMQVQISMYLAQATWRLYAMHRLRLDLLYTMYDELPMQVELNDACIQQKEEWIWNLKLKSEKKLPKITNAHSCLEKIRRLEWVTEGFYRKDSVRLYLNVMHKVFFDEQWKIKVQMRRKAAKLS